MKRISETERILECLVCPMMERCEREGWAVQGKEDQTGSCQFFKDAGYRVVIARNGCSYGFTYTKRGDKTQ